MLPAGGAHDAKGLLELDDRRTGHAAPAQSHQVEPGELVALGQDAERRGIERDPGAAPDHRALPHADELVKGRASAQDRVVADRDVAGEQDRVGHDYAVAHDAIVGDMRAGHEQAVLPHPGDAAGHRTAVDRDVFPDLRPGADLHPGLGDAVELQVLGIAADDREGMNNDAVAPAAPSA